MPEAAITSFTICGAYRYFAGQAGLYLPGGREGSTPLVKMPTPLAARAKMAWEG